MTVPARPYQGTSASDRVQNRRQKLIDVAFEAMTTDAWRTMSINELCRQAELNKRYFYESFAALGDLEAAVTEDISARVINIAFASAAEGNQQKLANLPLALKVIRAVCEYLMDDPRRARVLFGEISDTPVAKANRRQVINRLAVAVSSYGHVHYEAGDDTDPLASVASSLLVGGTIEAILNWLDGNIPLSRDQFIDDLALLWNINGDGVAKIARERRKA